MSELAPPPLLAATTIPALPDCARYRLAVDAAAVNAAIAGLARRHQLRADGEGRWTYANWLPRISGAVTAQADGAGFTLLELRIPPTVGASNLDAAGQLVQRLWPLWLMVVSVIRVTGVHLALCVAVTLVLAGLSILPIAGIHALLDRRRVARDRLWIAEWHGRFLGELSARLTPQGPYR